MPFSSAHAAEAFILRLRLCREALLPKGKREKKNHTLNNFPLTPSALDVSGKSWAGA